MIPGTVLERSEKNKQEARRRKKEARKKAGKEQKKKRRKEQRTRRKKAERRKQTSKRKKQRKKRKKQKEGRQGITVCLCRHIPAFLRSDLKSSLQDHCAFFAFAGSPFCSTPPTTSPIISCIFDLEKCVFSLIAINNMGATKAVLHILADRALGNLFPAVHKLFLV